MKNQKFIDMGKKSMWVAGFALLGVAVGGLEMTVGKSSDDEVEKVLSPYNLHEIRKTSLNFFCVEDPAGLPFTRVNFEAKNAQNEDVEGSICANRNFIKDSIEIKKKFKP